MDSVSNLQGYAMLKSPESDVLYNDHMPLHKAGRLPSLGCCTIQPVTVSFVVPQDFIASCGTYANLVRQAKSKQKILDKMEADGLTPPVR
eukprot:scaffold88470_cov24-Tisochrysis_lutea.AAC.3